LAESSVDIRVAGDTQPGRQWAVAREFRLRIKLAFDAEKIEMPFPHQVLVTSGQKAADGLHVRQASDG
jgi:small conductance mechanosensitive channel